MILTTELYHDLGFNKETYSAQHPDHPNRAGADGKLVLATHAEGMVLWTSNPLDHAEGCMQWFSPVLDPHMQNLIAGRLLSDTPISAFVALGFRLLRVYRNNRWERLTF